MKRFDTISLRDSGIYELEGHKGKKESIKRALGLTVVYQTSTFENMEAYNLTEV